VTMTCVSNEIGGPYISTANFTGVLLAHILQESGVRRRADQVFTTSIDGWTCGSPTAVLTDPGRQAMLVIEMNGEPLSIEHGFPIRMIVPRALRFRVRYQVDHRHGLTTFDTKRAYRLQRGWCSGPRSRRCPVSTVPARSDGSTRTLQSQVLHGRRQRRVATRGVIH
jgi:hypothetical protein